MVKIHLHTILRWRIKNMSFNKKTHVVALVILFFMISILIIPQPTSGQLNNKWEKAYGGSSKDVAKSVIFTDNGGLIIAGYTRSFGEGKLNNYHLVKTNNNGYTEWRRTYGGKYDDEAEDIIQTDDGEYAVAGSSKSFTVLGQEKGQYDFHMIKTNSKGKMDNNSLSVSFGGKFDEKCYSLIQTEDGGYILAGTTLTYTDGGKDFWVVKTDENGEVVESNNNTWKKSYGSEGDDVCRSVIKTDDGNYLLAGHTDSSDGLGKDAYIIKMDKKGEVLWSRRNGGEHDEYIYDAILTEDGGFVYVGSTTSYGAGEESFWLVKTNSEGFEEWDYSSNGKFDEVAYSVVQTKKGNYMMAGYTSSHGNGGNDFWVVEVNNKGKAVSKKTVGSGGNEIAYSITQYNDNDRFAVAGFTESYGAGQSDFWVVKIGRPYKIPVLWVIGGSAAVGIAIFTVFKLSKKYRFF